jgi:hypothetical protein
MMQRLDLDAMGEHFRRDLRERQLDVEAWAAYRGLLALVGAFPDRTIWDASAGRNVPRACDAHRARIRAALRRALSRWWASGWWALDVGALGALDTYEATLIVSVGKETSRWL